MSMDATNANILKNAAAATVRALLYLLGTWLVSKRALTSEANGRLQSHAGDIASGIVVFATAYVWSLWQKSHANKKVDRALKASPTLSRAQFETRQ